MSATFSGVEFYHKNNDLNMVVYQGKTIQFSYILGGDAPLDVTGYIARFQARDTDDNLIIEATSSDGRIAVGTTNGVFALTISATDSQTIEKEGQYEYELIAPNGKVYTAMCGEFKVKPRLIK